MYKPNDFNLTNTPKDMVKYILDNVEDFEPRYKHALNVMSKQRCPLEIADYELYADIYDKMCEWCNEGGFKPEDFDFEVEEIFG